MFGADGALFGERSTGETNPRASDLTGLFVRFGSAELARSLFRIIEAARIDARMLARYPGITPHYRHFAEREQLRREPTVITDLSGLLDALVLAGLGIDADALAAIDATGLLTPLCDALDQVRAPSADVYTSAAVLLVSPDFLGSDFIAEHLLDAEPLESGSALAEERITDLGAAMRAAVEDELELLDKQRGHLLAHRLGLGIAARRLLTIASQ